MFNQHLPHDNPTPSDGIFLYVPMYTITHLTHVTKWSAPLISLFINTFFVFIRHNAFKQQPFELIEIDT